MSAPRVTKIFGMRLGIDPKLLLGALAVVTAALLWYNLQGGTDAGTENLAANRVAVQSAVATPGKPQGHSPRRRSAAADMRPTLKFQTVDGSRGNIDPRLRLELLARLDHTPEPGRSRSLFETVAEPLPEIKGPVISPNLPPAVVLTPVALTVPAPATVAIPLKYYGFLKASGADKAKKGFFLDGGDVVIGAQGDILEQRYKLVSLTADAAELQDVESKMAQTLSAPSEITQ